MLGISESEDLKWHQILSSRNPQIRTNHMITLTAEVLCDSCGKVCGVGEPTASSVHKIHWSTTAIQTALDKARSHGAQINVASVTCAECLAKQKDFEETINHKPKCTSHI